MIQAVSGGEIFVLKMGEPVKIRDIVGKMIHLNGKVVGDEEMKTMLSKLFYWFAVREKLSKNFYCESLIDSSHPKIMIANDVLELGRTPRFMPKTRGCLSKSDYPLMRGSGVLR